MYASRGNPLYGELTPRGVTHLLEHLELGRGDVFYDLGAGVGKVILQAALTVPANRCVGIELSKTRCRLARAALSRAQGRAELEADRCSIRRADLLDVSLRDATCVYSCSTAFSLRFMARLVRKLLDLDRDLLFATLQEPEPRRGLELLRRVRVRTTWNRRTPVYIYQVHAGYRWKRAARRRAG